MLLAACGNSESNSKATAAPAGMRAEKGEVSVPEAGRRFLVVETLAPSESGAARAYFGRTAFRPKALSVVSAPFAGRVTSVAVEPGQLVREGDTLFTIESGDALGMRAALSSAKLREKLAEEVLARQSEMAKRGVGLEIERFEAEMKLREARAEVERNERNAALLGAGDGTAVHVRTSVAGVVVSVKAARGATVQPGGDPLVEIGNTSGLWIVADAPEGEVAQVPLGARAAITIDALNLSLTGRVAGVAPRSDPETRRTPVYVELERAPAGLRAGLLVRVTVTPRSGPDELWLPVSAVLLKEGGRRFVYLESGAGRYTLRSIEIGDERGGRVRVLRGLLAGERVVMRGGLLLDREAEQLL